MSVDNQPRPDSDLDLVSKEVIFRAYDEKTSWPPEKWLDLYMNEGLRIIPLYGAHDAEVYNPKKPGYPKWQKYVPSRNELVDAIHLGKMWGCVCGSVSGNLSVVDYDLDEILGSREAAMAWRTLVTFTPSGGFHVWLRTEKPRPKAKVISPVTRLIPFEMDLVRGEASQVIVPPSKLKDVGNYWFMDDSKIRRRQKLGIRVI
ncbi:hypothetical protein E6H29_11390 [Candidatus Bathyarchaeota archaeon]|nr:MAG: hypothetical protein E6H29_11390 [Candidatus Bathyarchaeota archaeon]